MIDLLCVGLGYSAVVFARRLRDAGAVVGGTTRSLARVDDLSAAGLPAVVFDGETASTAVTKALSTATHLVVSAAPDASGDSLLRCHHGDIAVSTSLTLDCLPVNGRSLRRLARRRGRRDDGAATNC